MLASSDEAELKRRATDRLIELANVERWGHFVAVAALNVLDTRATLNDEDRSRISKLPRQLRKPPPRVGKYVGRLLDKLAG